MPFKYVRTPSIKLILRAISRKVISPAWSHRLLVQHRNTHIRLKSGANVLCRHCNSNSTGSCLNSWLIFGWRYVSKSYRQWREGSRTGSAHIARRKSNLQGWSCSKSRQIQCKTSESHHVNKRSWWLHESLQLNALPANEGCISSNFWPHQTGWKWYSLESQTTPSWRGLCSYPLDGTECQDSSDRPKCEHQAVANAHWRETNEGDIVERAVRCGRCPEVLIGVAIPQGENL